MAARRRFTQSFSEEDRGIRCAKPPVEPGDNVGDESLAMESLRNLAFPDPSRFRVATRVARSHSPKKLRLKKWVAGRSLNARRAPGPLRLKVPARGFLAAFPCWHFGGQCPPMAANGRFAGDAGIFMTPAPARQKTPSPATFPPRFLAGSSASCVENRPMILGKFQTDETASQSRPLAPVQNGDAISLRRAY